MSRSCSSWFSEHMTYSAFLCDLIRSEVDWNLSRAFAGKDLEEQLRSVSSVDELMSVLYPDYWKMYKCQLRKGGWQQPTLNTKTGDNVKFAAAHYNTEILKSIDNEWRKTQCMPREVCIDVGKEFGAATNTFFKPPCVSVYRCGGCCNSEGLQCMNTSTGYLSKTVGVSYLSSTLEPSECQAANKTCPANYVWNNYMCRCLAQQDFIFYSNTEDDSTNGFHDVCGPNKELNEDTCQCVCKGGLQPSSCGPHKELDRNSCQCVCKNKVFPSSCGANREFDENTCQCLCKRTCPRNRPLNPGKCTCECTENTEKCFLKGKKFHHQTCSCYRRPCTNRMKHCEPGLSFSEEVCRCVPSYWKRPHMN
ncbi:Vegfc [Phodopus roborovskii]|uniref:Vascular endothelial growth factor C n=1 Tax=Phodopus roborovskii TaxID=109678 RepID=A0AAU9Z504_PHORO|nr:Vegfc [Phodopus roborovskii]